MIYDREATVEQNQNDVIELPTRCIIYYVRGVACIREARQFGYDEMQYPAQEVYVKGTRGVVSTVYTDAMPVHLWSDEALYEVVPRLKNSRTFPKEVVTSLLRDLVTKKMHLRENTNIAHEICAKAREWANMKLRVRDITQLLAWCEKKEINPMHRAKLRNTFLELEVRAHNHTAEFAKLFFYYVQRQVIRTDWKDDADVIGTDPYLHDFPKKYTDRNALRMEPPEYRQTKTKKYPTAYEMREQKIKNFYQDHTQSNRAKRVRTTGLTLRTKPKKKHVVCYNFSPANELPVPRTGKMFQEEYAN